MVYIHHLITEDGDFMSLNINSPSYFTSVYGVIEEIYRMCSDITNKIDLKKYTNTFDNIGITPIVAPTEEIDKGKCKEVRKIYQNLNLGLFHYTLTTKYIVMPMCKKRKTLFFRIFLLLF